MTSRHGTRLDAVIRRSPLEAVLLGLEQVTTEAGAVSILRAEQAGRRRPLILRTAERRVAQMRGQELAGMRTSLVAEGSAAEAPWRH